MTVPAVPDLWTTVVVDAGGRYGMHPSWRGFEAPIDYRMFEPEPVEAERLTRKYASRPDVTVHDLALGAERDSTIDLFITAHHGYIGATRPNPQSLWFGEVRPDEGIVQGTITVPATTLDAYLEADGLHADFLKVDVESHELRVLQGADKTLDRVLALRVELQFDDSFEKQTASSIFNHLIDDRDFRLMRFDYDGRGQPLSYLTVDATYGALCGCDAVFVRKLPSIVAWSGDETAAALLKLAAFSLRNGMPDYAVVCLDRLRDTGWSAGADEPAVHRYVRKLFILAAGRLRIQSGDLYELAAQDYQRFFDAEMPARHEVFESDWLNPA
ncbi:FkbM family methyltransferase [Thalassobaculum sp.]|uniref:FkbM family methyltransferase n=1 Tax=Thalassobaculum sp. TaxID=2022740 RepID=UPI0032EE9321